MAYLDRQTRQAAILQAATRIVIKEGLAAATVRRVASEAGIATGQVHHHFTSVAALRAEAFLLFIRQSMTTLSKQIEGLSAADRLQRVLADPDGEAELKLWNEAVLLAERDTPMKSACATAMADWHRAVVEIIVQGRSSGEFTDHDAPGNIALRLIGLSCGLDGMVQFEILNLSEEKFQHHITAAINKELQ